MIRVRVIVVAAYYNQMTRPKRSSWSPLNQSLTSHPREASRVQSKRHIRAMQQE